MNIQQLKGIGEKTAALLSRLSVYTVKDLVGLYPRAYDVYEKPVFVQEAVEEHASEIVSIEAGTFKEMVAVWHSLKGKLEELQDIYLKKEPDEWLDGKEVCKILSISSRSLQHLRNNGTLSFTRIDKKIFYRKQDVMSLLRTVQKKK